MKKFFFLIFCFSNLYPYIATNIATISYNETTTTTNRVDIIYSQYGRIKGSLTDTLNNFPLSNVEISLGTLSLFQTSTYLISQEIFEDNTKSIIAAKKAGYYEKQREILLSSTTTQLDISLCPKKQDIQGYSWRLISFPVEPFGNSVFTGSTLTVGDDLGEIKECGIYIWDEKGKEDPFLLKYTIPSTITIGKAYWFKYYRPEIISLSPPGTPTSGTITIPLNRGWNMVGGDVFKRNKERLKCQIGIETYPLGSLTENIFWKYEDDIYKETNILLPHFGYWIRAATDCLLVFPPTNWDDEEKVSIVSKALSDDYIRLIAKSGELQEEIIFGISENCLSDFDFGIDISKPPAFLDPPLYIAFINNGYLAKDIRNKGDDITWDVSIKGKTPIELSFEGLNKIDKDYQIFLVDSNNIIDLRKTPRYTLHSPKMLKIRFIKEGLIVQENRIVKAITYPNPASSEITFKIWLLAKGASFKLRIYNILGQKVYEGDLLQQSGKPWGIFDASLQAYIYESTYKGIGSHNLPLASGLYIYEINSYALNSSISSYGKFLIKR